MNNLEYKTKEIKNYYSKNRLSWNDFYPSEKWVFEKIAGKKENMGNILDVGCACGGLGIMLNERYRISSYTGVDINKDSISWAKNNLNLDIPVKLIANDILKTKIKDKYNIVFSLSCADWNIETKKIIEECWEKVDENGCFVISLRLSKRKSINDIKKSYQLINFFGEKEKPEKANYVVFSFKDAINILQNLKPHPILVGSYGYWGIPSQTAVTPFKKLVFAVFYVQKGKYDEKSTRVELNLPLDILI